MFKRYGEVFLRLEKLGGQVGKLSNSERQELQSLLEEQAWLSDTIVKKAKSVLEEIDQSFEKLFDWMILNSELIDRAAGQSGTPEDILKLENMMTDAASLREQLRRLNMDNNINSITKVIDQPVVEARLEVAPTAATVVLEPSSVIPVQANRLVKKKNQKSKNRYQ